MMYPEQWHGIEVRLASIKEVKPASLSDQTEGETYAWARNQGSET